MWPENVAELWFYREIYVLYMVLVSECACWRPMKAREDRKGCWIMNACLDMREPWRQKSEHDRRSCNLLLIMIINYLSCYYSRKSQSMFILRVSTPYTTMQVATMKRISSNSNYNSELSSSLRYVLGTNIPYESTVVLLLLDNGWSSSNWNSSSQSSSPLRYALITSHTGSAKLSSLLTRMVKSLSKNSPF